MKDNEVKWSHVSDPTVFGQSEPPEFELFESKQLFLSDLLKNSAIEAEEFFHFTKWIKENGLHPKQNLLRNDVVKYAWTKKCFWTWLVVHEYIREVKPAPKRQGLIWEEPELEILFNEFDKWLGVAAEEHERSKRAIVMQLQEKDYLNRIEQRERR